jgi:hypothetical protein
VLTQRNEHTENELFSKKDGSPEDINVTLRVSHRNNIFESNIRLGDIEVKLNDIEKLVVENYRGLSQQLRDHQTRMDEIDERSRLVQV